MKLIGPGGGSEAPKRTTVDITWAARTDDPLDEADTILTDAAVVNVGDQLVTNLGIWPLWVTKVTAVRNVDVHTMWIIKATYEQTEPKDVPRNPLARASRIWWSFEDVEFYPGHDRRGNVYKNPAGQFFSDPPPTLVTMMVLNVQKNLAAIDLLAFRAAQNAVNLDTFLVFGPGFCKIAMLEPDEPQVEDNTGVVTVTTAIQCSAVAFHPHQILNQGTYYLDAPGGEKVQNNIDGVYTDKQFFLALDGTKLGAGANPTFSEFYPFPEMFFSNLAQLIGLIVTP